jgi:uncharacterized CHY-type Zn-finger protein
MITLKTQRRWRYFCSFCKSVLTVSEDTEHLFVAHCPRYHRFGGQSHDNLYLRFPDSGMATCGICKQEFKIGVELLDGKNVSRCPGCHQPLDIASGEFSPTSTDSTSPLVQEAMRIFCRSVPGLRKPKTEQANENV